MVSEWSVRGKKRSELVERVTGVEVRSIKRRDRELRCIGRKSKDRKQQDGDEAEIV